MRKFFSQLAFAFRMRRLLKQIRQGERGKCLVVGLGSRQVALDRRAAREGRAREISTEKSRVLVGLVDVLRFCSTQYLLELSIHLGRQLKDESRREVEEVRILLGDADAIQRGCKQAENILLGVEK